MEKDGIYKYIASRNIFAEPESPFAEVMQSSTRQFVFLMYAYISVTVLTSRQWYSLTSYSVSF